MPSLDLPNNADECRKELTRRLRARHDEGLVAHLRVVVVLDRGEWAPACGRIDVARAADAPVVPSRPRGEVRLLSESISIPELIERLESAFRGEPFVVEGQPVAGHGMQGRWMGETIRGDWGDYFATWPIAVLSADQVARPQYVREPIEADGDIEAFDGLDHCIRRVMGFRYLGSAREGRFKRFEIVEWDYRGVAHATVSEEGLRVRVEPGGDPNLSLAVVVVDAGSPKLRTFPAPSEVGLIRFARQLFYAAFCPVLTLSDDPFSTLSNSAGVM